ncbi:NAD(P)-binding Rossmann-fold superfamily protein [Striga hermonthica]|uniref:NAD(P)-binding Rossmann-fold superfamily protein n=1 Tax=Striga hermonthica TaxID=68872 RepID=A0A9N7R0P5_STRHE|nr:NAD(P)-binding Rossmann-fold superfamily protein [Striga hermonthica]
MAEKIGSTVCVTGAGGYVASWLIKLLLSHGYNVHGTVRNPGDDKYFHLKQLNYADEKLKLVKADLLSFDSILAAVKGCDGVFHVASPVPSGSVRDGVYMQVEVVAPAVEGTRNILKACFQAKVGRVVVVSSAAALIMNPNWVKGQVIDENCWSDSEYCRATKNWYCYSKTVAEAEALEFAKNNELDLVTVCPTAVWGPMLQHTPNASTLILIKLLREGFEEVEDKMMNIVDVRDVAEALKLVYEHREAKGRYICTAHTIKTQDLVGNLKQLYPHYNYPKSFKEGKNLLKLSSEKLQGLGWKYRPLTETLVDSVEMYKEAGLIHSS